MKALLSSSTRFASAGTLLLSLFFAGHAAMLFYGVANHQVRDDMLFRVVTCCDIPSDSIVANATGTATTLGIGACIGLLIGWGIWHARRAACWGALVWCAVIALHQWIVAQDLVPMAQGEHFTLIYYCLGTMALLVVALVSVPKTTAGSSAASFTDAPIASPRE